MTEISDLLKQKLKTTTLNDFWKNILNERVIQIKCSKENFPDCSCKATLRKDENPDNYEEYFILTTNITPLEETKKQYVFRITDFEICGNESGEIHIHKKNAPPSSIMKLSFFNK